MISLDKLKKGDKAVIKDLITEEIPLTLLEMGCLPGNEISILGLASKKDLYTLRLMNHICLLILLQQVKFS